MSRAIRLKGHLIRGIGISGTFDGLTSPIFWHSGHSAQNFSTILYMPSQKTLHFNLASVLSFRGAHPWARYEPLLAEPPNTCGVPKSVASFLPRLDFPPDKGCLSLPHTGVSLQSSVGPMFLLLLGQTGTVIYSRTRVPHIVPRGNAPFL